MKLLDKIAFNRTLAIILSFILSLVKIFSPKAGKDLEDKIPIPPLVKPPLRKRGLKKKTDE